MYLFCIYYNITILIWQIVGCQIDFKCEALDNCLSCLPANNDIAYAVSIVYLTKSSKFTIWLFFF
jgi:hypothetical protein